MLTATCNFKHKTNNKQNNVNAKNNIKQKNVMFSENVTRENVTSENVTRALATLICKTQTKSLGKIIIVTEIVLI